MFPVSSIRKTFFLALALVLLASLGGRLLASEALPPLAEDAQADIRVNQKRLKELLPAVHEFNALKLDNAAQEGRLSTQGYRFDYQSNKAVKAEAPLTQ